MSNNARLIEKEIMASASLQDAAGGDSIVVDLSGASKMSCQCVYKVLSFSAAAITTANITISSDPTHPSQFKKIAHGFTTGLVVRATTAGTLAAPLVLATNYYVIKIDADYFALASSLANALAGTKIAITNVGVTSTTLTASALTSASVTYKMSNDNINWVNIQAATTVTVSGSDLLSQPNVAYRYLKVTKAITSGSFNLKAFVLAVGPA